MTKVWFAYWMRTSGSEQYGIGFRKDDTELCKLGNDGLKQLADNGKIDEIG